ncbi:MAG: tetratricopeptide repeat protein [Promethearchaeota archaeon]
MKKTFQDKFTHVKGQRCPICDLPVTNTPFGKVVYACEGCGRSFVREEKKMITIENYLDPENIFQFDNYTYLSPAFQNLLREEKQKYQMNSPFNRMGIVVGHMGRYVKWAEYGEQCIQTNRFEEAIHSMVFALHDYQINAGFWLNIAQITCNFDMFDICDRAITIARKLDPKYEPLKRITRRINDYRQNFIKFIENLTPTQKISNSILKIVDNNLRIGNLPRALVRLKQALQFDPSNPMIWDNIASISLEMGDINSGKEALEKSMAINSQNPFVHYIYMNYYLLIDNIPMAIQKVKDALALDPNNPRFQAKLQQMEGAIKMNNREPNNRFDFGYATLSTEEIWLKFSKIRTKDNNKVNIINKLSSWIAEQVRQRGDIIPYPDIYQKTKKFVQLYF